MFQHPSLEGCFDFFDGKYLCHLSRIEAGPFLNGRHIACSTLPQDFIKLADE